MNRQIRSDPLQKGHEFSQAQRGIDPGGAQRSSDLLPLGFQHVSVGTEGQAQSTPNQHVNIQQTPARQPLLAGQCTQEPQVPSVSVTPATDAADTTSLMAQSACGSAHLEKHVSLVDSESSGMRSVDGVEQQQQQEPGFVQTQGHNPFSQPAAVMPSPRRTSHSPLHPYSLSSPSSSGLLHGTRQLQRKDDQQKRRHSPY